MKVTLHPADQAACGYYRIKAPARIARAEGVEINVTGNVPMMYEQGAEPRRMRPQPSDSDVIVFQRPAKLTTLECMPFYQRAGIAVVVDVDDDFSCLHPNHPAHDAFNPSLSPDVNHRHLHRACAIADLVTVTTPALAERYGGHGRVAVLPNCVPASILDLPFKDNGKTLGWSGAVQMHPGDLEATRGGVAEALRRSGWDFHVVGPSDGVRQALALDQEPSETGWVATEDWHEALGQIDVGIVPLGTSRFNAAKSWLKGLEYAARGIPFVASPLPEYQALAEEGIGILAADRSRNWRAQLGQLMSDESLRWEMATKGREIVAEYHLMETNGWRWVEAWQTAIDRRAHEPTKANVAPRSVRQAAPDRVSAPADLLAYSTGA